MNKKLKKPYDKEFKENTVNLYLKSNRPCREIAKNLGIAKALLRKSNNYGHECSLKAA